VHKIQGPDNVLLGWRNQGLLGQFRKTALGSPWEIEPHVLVNPPDPFVVPQIPVVTHPAKAQPKAPTTMLGHDLVEHIDYRRVPLGPICGLAVISCPG